MSKPSIVGIVNVDKDSPHDGVAIGVNIGTIVTNTSVRRTETLVQVDIVAMEQTIAHLRSLGLNDAAALVEAAMNAQRGQK